MSLFLRQDSGAHLSVFQYFIASPHYVFLPLICCLLLKSLNRQLDTVKWAVHLNQNCWPSGILFEKRTQVGYMNNNPNSSSQHPMRQKKIHCQGDNWERLLSPLVMGCDYHVLWAAFAVASSRCLSVWKHQSLSSSPWRQLQLPGGRRTKRAAAALPLTSDSSAHKAKASTASIRWMFALAIRCAHCHGNCIRQFSPKHILCWILLCSWSF